MVSNNTSSENEIEFGEQQCFDTPKEEALYWKQVAVDYMQRYVQSLKINCPEPNGKKDNCKIKFFINSTSALFLEIIHLVRTQVFFEKPTFLTHLYAHVLLCIRR